MARATIAATLERRAQVEALDLRGASVRAIARAVHADARTVRADLAALAAERRAQGARAGQVPAGRAAEDARRRLVAAARLAGQEAWTRLARCAAGDESSAIGYLRVALASQEREAKLLDALEAGDLEARIAALEAASAPAAGSGRTGGPTWRAA